MHPWIHTQKICLHSKLAIHIYMRSDSLHWDTVTSQLHLMHRTQYRVVGRYVHSKKEKNHALTNIDRYWTNIYKKQQCLAKTHIFQKQNACPLLKKEKTLGASLKRSQHGLGTLKRAFSKRVRLSSTTKKRLRLWTTRKQSLRLPKHIQMVWIFVIID